MDNLHEYLKKSKVVDLRKIVKEYNLDVKIPGYYKMKKDDLIKNIKKHIPSLSKVKEYQDKAIDKSNEKTYSKSNVHRLRARINGLKKAIKKLGQEFQEEKDKSKKKDIRDNAEKKNVELKKLLQQYKNIQNN